MLSEKYHKYNDSLKSDFLNIFNQTSHLWKDVKNKKIFLTGCTGFFGYWILRSFIKANKDLKLNSKIFVLTRKKNIKKSNIFKLCNDKAINFYIGDIRNFKYPKEKFDFIIHGATTSALETFKKQDPLEKCSIIVDGTRHILNFAKKCKCKKFLYLSSGAVYGYQPPNIKKISEDSDIASKTNNKDFDNSALGQSKRMAELLVTIYSQKNYFSTSIARCFSFVGPLIPLDIHYAIGNFLKNAALKKSIYIKSDGQAVRSYMYMTDLTAWIWKILFKGKNLEIYNVGSEEEIRIKDLAKLINKLTGNKKKILYRKKNEKKRKNRYIPSNFKIKKELKVIQKVKLKDAILKTYRNINNNRKFYNI